MNFFDYLLEELKLDSKLFIIGDKEKISFQELYDQSVKIAEYVKNYCGKGKNVILIAPNSVFFITVYLGILKSGNVCIPIDQEVEQSNLDYIADLTESKLVFSTELLLKKLKFKNDLAVLNKCDTLDIISKSNPLNYEGQFDQNSLAEIVFTSGSTGRPKGVMLSHKNLIANTESILDYLGLTSEDIICNVLPFNYCYGLSVLHTHLKAGASMILNNSFVFIGSVINDLKKHECTGFSGVPSHFQILLQKSSLFKNNDLPHLRYMTQAGGKLHNSFIMEICNAMPKLDFFIMYGQTEATARLTYLSPEFTIDKLGSIGKPISGVEYKILNDEGVELGPEENGELVVKGGNIMLGYYKDPEATSSKLKKGWLFTGDVAKIDNDGFLYIVARKSEFIKVRGKRVSPKEIEDILFSFSAVIDCSVQGIEDELYGEAIKVDIIVRPETNKEELKNMMLQECKSKLAPYKVPSYFSFVDDIKLNSSGKKIINN